MADELVPIAGLLEIRGQSAVVHTSGYLDGEADVRVGGDQLRRYGLRTGDAVTGTARNATSPASAMPLDIAEVNSINGVSLDIELTRPHFADLPVNAARVATLPSPALLTIGLAEKITHSAHGHALVIEHGTSGRTRVLHALATLSSYHYPEAHPMMLLSGVSDEEWANLTRTVTGEIIAVPDTGTARHREIHLAIERGKRLVEQGHDVRMLMNFRPPESDLEAARDITGGGALSIVALKTSDRNADDETVDIEVIRRQRTAGDSRAGAAGKAMFISYRRDDTGHVAGRLADRLRDRFGDQTVFVDVDAIEPGQDFVATINAALEQCRVLLILIGPTWNAGDTPSRLDDSDDVVRIELEVGLRSGMHIIPVLIDDTRMPGREELPPSIRQIVRINAARVRYETFRDDTLRLISVVDRAFRKGDG